MGVGLRKSYDDLLLSNMQRLSSIESCLRTLSYVLPGRFQDAEFASEALSAALNTVSLYHDSVLRTAADALPEPIRPKPSPHNRYTRYWSNASLTYAQAARLLTVIGYSQVLVEMLAYKKLTRDKRWKVIIALETIKATLRLAILHATGYRPSITPPLPTRDVDPTLFDKLAHDEQANTCWTGSRTGQTHLSITAAFDKKTSQWSQRDIENYLIDHKFTIQDVQSPENLVLPLRSFAERWNEVVWILRPLIYVVALRKYGSRSYLPFCISLALEQPAVWAGQSRTWNESKLERTERTNRQMQMERYMLRGPAWAALTKPLLQKVADDLEKRPLVSYAGSMLGEYITLFDRLYYYSAT